MTVPVKDEHEVHIAITIVRDSETAASVELDDLQPRGGCLQNDLTIRASFRVLDELPKHQPSDPLSPHVCGHRHADDLCGLV